jgi:rubrerythrin
MPLDKHSGPIFREGMTTPSFGGTILFTMTDLCDIAIQIERNGEAAYRRSGEMTDRPEIMNMLRKLADDELKHAKWFADLNLTGPSLPDDSPLETAGRELIQGMMENQSFSLDPVKLSQAQKIEDILAQSIEFEKDTIIFYEMMGGFIDDENVIEKLDSIIGEERMHVATLKSILMDHAQS